MVIQTLAYPIKHTNFLTLDYYFKFLSETPVCYTFVEGLLGNYFMCCLIFLSGGDSDL